MAKLSVNLLPIEFREQDLKNAKFSKIQTIGLSVIITLVFLSSVVVALRVLQSQNISRIQNNLTQSEQKLTTLKNTQASLIILRNRLNAIDQYLGTSSNQTQIYKIITKLLPPRITLTSVSVDKNGDISLLLTSPDGNTLDSVVASLLSKESNEGRVSQIALENISRGKDGIYRLGIKVKSKANEK